MSDRPTSAKTLLLATLFAALCVAPARARSNAPQDPPAQPGAAAADNPYRLEPFLADFPVPLEYPRQHGLEYDRTRRQMLQRIASNLQGNVRREAWLMAQEFYWRAPEDAIDPLIEALDRAMANPALGDVVKNCVEAMGRMADERFDGALRRALQHKNDAARQAAYGAMATCGTVRSLQQLENDFELMNGRSRGAWLTALRERAPAAAPAIYERLLQKGYQSDVQDEVLAELLRLEASVAAEVLRPRFAAARGERKARMAALLHTAGDAAGTAWLHEALQSADVKEMMQAILHCPIEALGELRNDLLRTTTHQNPDVRHAAATVLAKVDGDDVADVFEVLAAPDESWEVRSVALRELTRRGRPALVSLLLDEVPTATGIRLQTILNQLAVCGDERAAPVLLQRFREAPDGEGRPFLQALAQNASGAAIQALCEVYSGPLRLVARTQSGGLTTQSYVPTLLLNARGHEGIVLGAYRDLPRDAYVARAGLLTTLSGIAADRKDEGVRAQCAAPLREVLFDREELPQLRVLALNQMTQNWLTIDDALRLKNMKHDEAPGMRALFTDFLLDYF